MVNVVVMVPWILVRLLSQLHKRPVDGLPEISFSRRLRLGLDDLTTLSFALRLPCLSECSAGTLLAGNRSKFTPRIQPNYPFLCYPRFVRFVVCTTNGKIIGRSWAVAHTSATSGYRLQVGRPYIRIMIRSRSVSHPLAPR